jgi:hypothetical protein
MRRILNRLIPALCFNVVMIIGMDETYGISFTYVMGSINFDSLIIFGNFIYMLSINFPLLIFLIALLTVFNVKNRIVYLFRSKKRFNYKEIEKNEDVKNGYELFKFERARKLEKLTFGDVIYQKNPIKNTTELKEVRTQKKTFNNFDKFYEDLNENSTLLNNN